VRGSGPDDQAPAPAVRAGVHTSVVPKQQLMKINIFFLLPNVY
jgi:hypothetical protein